MWCLGTWFSDELGSVRLMVGLDDLKGLFQPKWFCDSMILLGIFHYSYPYLPLLLMVKNWLFFLGSVKDFWQHFSVGQWREWGWLLTGVRYVCRTPITDITVSAKLYFLLDKANVPVAGTAVCRWWGDEVLSLSSGPSHRHGRKPLWERLIGAPKYCYGHSPYAICTRAGQKASSWSLDLPHHVWFAQRIPDYRVGMYVQLWCCLQSIPL